MMKRGDETFLTKEEALRDARAVRKRLERGYANPFEAKEYRDEIKNADDLFDFYKLCRGYGIVMEWRGFKKRWYGLNHCERNEIYNYIGMFRERECRDIAIRQVKLIEGLAECMADNEMVVDEIIHFRNDDVPNFLKRLRRAERYSLEHPSKLKFMTGAA